MALTITKEPPEINLSENDILFGLQTNGYITLEHPYSRVYVGFNAVPNVDDELRIYSDLFDVTFTFKANPDNSGTQLPQNFPDVESFIVGLIEAMLENYDIYTNATVKSHAEGYAGGIVIQSKTLGVQNYSGEVITGAFAISSSFPGFDVPTNYKIGCIGDGAISELIPDHEGNVEFNLKELFELKGGFTWPEAGYAPIEWPDFCKEFAIKYFEADGNERSKLYDITKLICLGGIDKKALAYFADENTNWISYITSNHKFLTCSPVDVIIDISQTVKLYFLNQLAIQIKFVWMANDDEQTKDTYEFTPSKFGIVTITALSLADSLMIVLFCENADKTRNRTTKKVR